MDEDEVKYVITPWGIMTSVLNDYGINLPPYFTGVMGEHMVDDFMKYMEKSGYVVHEEDERGDSESLTLKEKALMLLLEWAVECGFWFDSFQEEYEEYKEDIKDMDYMSGMIYIAEKVVKNERPNRTKGSD